MSTESSFWLTEMKKCKLIFVLKIHFTNYIDFKYDRFL